MMQVIRRANISSCMDIIICCISTPIHSSRTIQYLLTTVHIHCKGILRRTGYKMYLCISSYMLLNDFLMTSHVLRGDMK